MKYVLGLLLWSHTAFAGLTLSLNPVAQPVSAGAEALFSGTLTNTSATDRLFLNDVMATFTADPQGDTALSSNAFFGNVPGILLPGETYDGPLFRISLSGISPAANYSGTITLQGGADITAGTDLASTSFTLLATPVDQWRHASFGDDAGSALAADDADWDHDGTPNLLEYALALNALVPDSQGLPAPTLLNNYLTLSYVPSAADVQYTIESSSNLLQWGTTDVEAVSIANPLPPNRLTFRYRNAVSPWGKAFLRLKVVRMGAGL
ncbi:MAG: hypothetical protein B7Z37_11200 [Verrucomicrobia bacterium 12-59-8]|nr:MAG: hypothetical protein B7Z37_11200 [Verrucomicrobia bacterium 12-59-8]